MEDYIRQQRRVILTAIFGFVAAALLTCIIAYLFVIFLISVSFPMS